MSHLIFLDHFHFSTTCGDLVHLIERLMVLLIVSSTNKEESIVGRVNTLEVVWELAFTVKLVHSCFSLSQHDFDYVFGILKAEEQL